jgi:lipopolysaccharide/colanic/teichoic acid biosynthesis glycosyltransferase
MTTSTRALEPAGQDPSASVTASEPDPELRAIDESPSWPVTRLAAWSLMLALGVSILAPASIASEGHEAWPALVVPAIAATLGARALFEGLAFASRSRRGPHQLLVALPPALLAAAVMAGSSAVVEGRVGAAASGATALLTALTLTAAGAARNVEVRIRLAMRRVYFIGSDAARRDLERELSYRRDARLVGHASPTAPAEGGRLAEAVRAARATVLVLDNEAMRLPELIEVALQLNLAGLRIRDLASYYESEFKKVPLTELNPTWFLFDIAPIHRRVYRVMRRVFEVLAASLLLVISLPILAVAAIVIKLSSAGAVLYRQERVGKDGVPFTLIKLRTMMAASDSVSEWAQSQADRITPVGRVLRRFRLDEVPQLWNVIAGDLALVGPRPEQVPIVERLEHELAYYKARHCIRPGITGWAQVNLGYAGSAEGTVAKLQRDLYYVKHSRLRLDGLILWLTLRAIIAGRGSAARRTSNEEAAQQGTATSP